MTKSLVLFNFILFFSFFNHQFINTTLLKAFLTFRFISTTQVNFISYLFTFGTRNTGYNCSIASTVISSALFNNLVILTYIFKIIIFFNYYMITYYRLSSLYICNPFCLCLTIPTVSCLFTL